MPERAWRTGKNADLIRMLAVREGRPLAVRSAIDALWPDSDERRAQASLRTAVSLARGVIGHEHVERLPAGLTLNNVWVDVVAFRGLVAHARQAVRAGDHSLAAMLAQDADDLYGGELQANDVTADWLLGERRCLAKEYLSVLCDRAEAEIARANGHDAVELARRALLADPFSERASRLLMRSAAAIGELPLAVHEYERCRRLLADELGIDPSPQTEAVYLGVLRGTDVGALGALEVRGATELTAITDAPPLVRAESQIRRAMSECLPQRDFDGCRLAGLDAADLPVPEQTKVRALTIACLPDVLFGRPHQASRVLERAVALGSGPQDNAHRSRLDVLSCLIAHDTDSADFEGWWAVASAWCDTDTDVNWAWLVLRIAAERGDHEMLRAALALRMAPSCGPLSRRLHALAAAVAMGHLGDVDGAVNGLRAVIAEEERAGSSLLVPESLAWLVLLRAKTDPSGATRDLARLDAIGERTTATPRESFLRLLARAELESSRGRMAAASADAARAIQIAQDNGLRTLAVIARDHWSRHFESARVWASRELPATLPRLRLVRSTAGPDGGLLWAQ